PCAGALPASPRRGTESPQLRLEWPTSRREDPQRSRCRWDRRRPWLRPDNHVIMMPRAPTAGVHLPEAEDRPLVSVPLDLRLRSKRAELSIVRSCKPHPVHLLGLETLVVLLSPTGAPTRVRGDLEHRPSRDPRGGGASMNVPVRVRRRDLRINDDVEIAPIQKRHGLPHGVVLKPVRRVRGGVTPR